MARDEVGDIDTVEAVDSINGVVGQTIVVTGRQYHANGGIRAHESRHE